MLLCSSKLPVMKSCTPSALTNLATEWILASRNYSFKPFSWDGSPEFICRGDNGEVFQIGLFEKGRICAVHFSATDNRNIKWTTDFILDTDENILAFQLYRDAPANTNFVRPDFSLPYLVRSLISAGYCDQDNELTISKEPIFAHEEDVDWIANLMLRNKKYNLPIVYMSCEQDGHGIVNPYMLADKLNGVAHVVFETTRAVSYELREKTGGTNPYSGAVEIYYSNGTRRFLPTQISGTHSQKVYTIVNALFAHLVQLQIEDKFSWSQLQSNKLKQQLSIVVSKKEQDSKDYEQFEKTYEEILAEKDSTIKQLRDQLYSANATIAQMESQLALIEDVPALIVGKEHDLYPHEQQSMLCEILARELKATQENTRKFHVLNALLEANRCENTVADKRAKIKQCLRAYKKMTPTLWKELESIGFSLTDDGKHIKAVFEEDPRYMGTLSKTGSDHRGGENIVHELIRLIF